MIDNIILNKEDGMIIAIADDFSKASISLNNGQIDIKIEEIIDNKIISASLLQISKDNIVFEANYINIICQDFNCNYNESFSMQCENNNFILSKELFLNSQSIKFDISQNTKISSRNLIFS